MGRSSAFDSGWLGALVRFHRRSNHEDNWNSGDSNIVTFAVFDADHDSIVNVEEIRIPAAFQIPAALKYVRSNLLDVLREYGVERAGVRVTEPNAQTMSIERI